jgi:hypothetical protein
LKASKAISSKSPRRGAPPRETGSSSRTDERFHLTGPSLQLDARVHAYRKDIADIALAGQIFAPHYARPLLRVADGEIAVRAAASDDSENVATLAAGERFAVLEYAGGWAWGYVEPSHCVGYVPADLLAEPI